LKRSFADYIAIGARILDLVLTPKYFWLGLLAFTFLLSSGFTLASPWRRAATVWFPDYRVREGARSRSELRYLPPGRSLEETAADLADELFLGPLEPYASPISVADARLRSVIHSGKTLYIDVSSSILFGRMNDQGVYGEPPLDPQRTIGYLERSIRWNLPGMHVVMTVDGLEPSWGSTNTKVSGKTE
jgi:hypothetical protein